MQLRQFYLGSKVNIGHDAGKNVGECLNFLVTERIA